MLKKLAHVTRKIETKFYVLSSFRAELDMTPKDVGNNKNNVDHNLHDYELGARCIDKMPNKLPSLHFTNGIVKTQNND